MVSGQSVAIDSCRMPWATAGAGNPAVAPAANDPAPARTSRRLIGRSLPALFNVQLALADRAETIRTRRQPRGNNRRLMPGPGCQVPAMEREEGSGIALKNRDRSIRDNGSC